MSAPIIKTRGMYLLSYLFGVLVALCMIVIAGALAYMIGSIIQDMVGLSHGITFDMGSLGGVVTTGLQIALLGVLLGFLAFVGSCIAVIGSGLFLLVWSIKELIVYPFVRKQLLSEWLSWHEGARQFAVNNHRAILETTPDNSLSLRDFGTLLPSDIDARAWPLFSAQISSRDAQWYFVGSKESSGGYVVLRIDVGAVLPSVVVVSKIRRDGKLLTTHITGVESVPLTGDMADYFEAKTRRPQVNEALQVLTPDVLEKILFRFDACDVEMRDTHLDIVWDAAMLDCAFLEREKTVVEFVREVLEQVDTMSLKQQPHFKKLTVSWDRHLSAGLRLTMSSIKYVGIVSGVLAVVLPVLDIIGVIPDFEWGMLILVFPGIIVVWTLLALSCFMLFAIIYAVIRGLIAGYASMRRLAMRRKYVMYYAGRV